MRVGQMPELLMILIKYVTPMVLILATFYLIPRFVVHKVTQFERCEKRSEKEEGFVTRNLCLMIMNCLLIPIALCTTLTLLDEEYIMIDPTPNIPKLPRNVAASSSPLSLFSSKVDNMMNEFMARLLSNSEE